MPEQPARRPYNASSVQYVDRGTIVTALYIPDSQQAKNPSHVLMNILDRNHEGVEIVAEMRRYYKRDGASVSGWMMRSGTDHGSEPYPNKCEAMQALRIAVADYFKPQGNA